MQAAVNSIIAHHPGQTVLVVTHGAALRSLVAHVLGASLTQLHRIAIGGNTTLSIVQIDHGAPTAGQLQRHRTPGWRLPGVQRRGRWPEAACQGGQKRMSNPTPLALFAGLFLILYLAWSILLWYCGG